ncbi:MAG TPA: hypothetical protein VHV75_18340 [Solirubrobacteraceae bacterium]|nr:hypothetical protein [Solirubrobacteraceae bacterium]
MRDVIVCPTFEVQPEVGIEELRAHPPVGFHFAGIGAQSGTVEIGNGVRIDRLPDNETELVMNACSPRGHHFVPIRQFGQRYSLIRELDPKTSGSRSGWDEDGVLWDCLSLSRLVRDNAFSTQYAARVLDYADDQQRIIYALDPAARQVYRLRTNRDWLDPDEGQELGQLAATYWTIRDELPERVRRAMWRCEFSSWMAWADVALPIIVSGLEALLKTERHGATRQFTTRVPLLAEYLGIAGISPQLCEDIYDGRSEWIHGAHVRLFAAGQPVAPGSEELREEERDILSAVASLQDVLRASVRRAIEDPATRRIFESDDHIRDCWSLPS